MLYHTRPSPELHCCPFCEGESTRATRHADMLLATATCIGAVNWMGTRGAAGVLEAVETMIREHLEAEDRAAAGRERLN